MKFGALAAIDGVGDHHRLWIGIAQLAASQLGHVTRAQVLALGADDSWISRALRAGRLVRVYPGVYGVGYRRVDRHAVAMAAVLRCGPSALLSHGSAAWLWGFGAWPRKHEVTIAGDRRPRGIVVHRSRTLTADDRDRQLGISVTSPERTLRDIRPRLEPQRFRRAVSDARIAGHASAEVAERLLGDGVAPTRSEMQDRFQRTVIEPFGVPQPLTDVVVNGFEVDNVWLDQKVIAELDGWNFHRDRHHFVRDRERDAVHADHGFVVLRITWERMQQPEREAERLLRILRRRGYTGR